MKKELEIHPVQATILRELIYKPDARFSELNITELTNDHFTFHIGALVTSDLVEKTEQNTYRLTAKGKEFANRFDTDSRDIKVERQAKLGVAICCVKEENGVTKYLLQQRLKQPYYGHWGFMTGKVKWGESVYETAKRELEEEMGITADLTLISIKHKTDFSEAGDLLEDKYFFKFRGDNPQGELIESFEGGKNAWLSRQEAEQLDKVFQDLYEGLDSLNRDNLAFLEQTYTVKEY